MDSAVVSLLSAFVLSLIGLFAFMWSMRKGLFVENPKTAGSIFAAVSMLIVTSLFSLYATNVANYSLLYGSLASLIAMMIWFYLLGWTLGLGVMLNKAWRSTKVSSQKE